MCSSLLSLITTAVNSEAAEAELHAFAVGPRATLSLESTSASQRYGELSITLQSNHRNRPSGWLLWVADSTGRCRMAGPFFVCVNFVEISMPPTPKPCGPVYAAIVEDAQVELSQANACARHGGFGPGTPGCWH